MAQNNGCGTEGCNVLLIVEGLIKGVTESTSISIDGLRQLIIEKFENIEKNNLKEANRIDELRKGDIEAVRIANDSTVKRAELLGQQVIETAEAVRKTTDTLATTIATNLKTITDRQDEKIAALERDKWENTGKAGVTPSVQSLITDLTNLKNANTLNAGISTGQQLTKASFVKGLVLAISIITLLMGLIVFFKA